MDDLIKLATGGISSTSAMGEGVTEGDIFLFSVNVDNSAILYKQESKIIDLKEFLVDRIKSEI